MDLDEAIIHCRDKAAEQLKEYEKSCFLGNPTEGCLKCSEEHAQLACWLLELKDYREGKRSCENCKYIDTDMHDSPCNKCRNNYENKFEWQKDKEITDE